MRNRSRIACSAGPQWPTIGELALTIVLFSGIARGSDLAQSPVDVPVLAEQVQSLESHSERLPPIETPQPDSPESSLTIGGALRLNYGWRDYSQQDKDKAGDFGFELFRLDVDGDYGDLGLSAQYRWYAPFEAVHHGYISYDLLPEWEAQLGIHQVPFGILPYASHSFWFGATYYLGFEDDYDTGLKLLYEEGPWDLQLAFYKNPEYVDSSRAERYSFDLITRGEQANEETNQLNFRLAYDWEMSQCLKVNLGASVEGGQIYNQITEGMGDRFAYALHSDLVYGDWNLQLQWIDYFFRPENPLGVDPHTVQLAAFEFPFLVAADAQVATINLARTFPIESHLVDKVTCYADFSKVLPETHNSHDSTQLVLGCLLVAEEHAYLYVDWIVGQNMWFAGGSGIGLSRPESDEWQSRLNVNLGLYF